MIVGLPSNSKTASTKSSLCLSKFTNLLFSSHSNIFSIHILYIHIKLTPAHHAASIRKNAVYGLFARKSERPHVWGDRMEQGCAGRYTATLCLAARAAR